MAKFGFNPAEVESSATVGVVSRDPIPAGEYTLSALEADEKATKDGTGSYINVKFEVIGGEHDGRWLWNIFNINNKSEKAQAIGRQQLVQWATACGRPDADDTDKLLGRKFQAVVSIEKGTGGYSDSNRIRAFVMPEAEKRPAAAPRTAAAPAAPAAPRTAPAGKNPWE